MKRNGFTFAEMVVVLAAVMLLIALFLPAHALLANAQTGQSQQAMKNAKHLQRIQTGLVLFGQGNNYYYIGIKADGVTIDPTIGLTTQGRIQRLIDDNYFTQENARSPIETQTGVTSYAMPKIDFNPDGKTIVKSIRNSEWKDTINKNAPVVSDRAIPVDKSGKIIKSVYTITSPDTAGWHGNVAWNDNHVTFETTYNLTTKYGKTTHASDNLFATDNLDNGDDAFMVFHGTDGL